MNVDRFLEGFYQDDDRATVNAQELQKMLMNYKHLERANRQLKDRVEILSTLLDKQKEYSQGLYVDLKA